MVHNGTAIYGSYVGVGTRDSKLTVGNLMEAAKVCKQRSSGLRVLSVE